MKWFFMQIHHLIKVVKNCPDKCIEAKILYVDTAKPDCPLYTIICIFTVFSFINCSVQSLLLPQPLNVSWVFKLFFLPNSVLKALNLPPSYSQNQLILFNNLHFVQTRFSKAYLCVRPGCFKRHFPDVKFC